MIRRIKGTPRFRWVADGALRNKRLVVVVGPSALVFVAF
jgi:hypothetical protein